MANFADQVKGFAEKAKARQLAIFRKSAEQVMERANVPKAQGGRMPVDTSALRNSTVAGIGGPEAATQPPALVFATMQVGQTVTAGWSVAYARRMEYGFFGTDSLGREYAQQGNGFLRAQTQNWAFIVDEVTQQIKAQNP